VNGKKCSFWLAQRVVLHVFCIGLSVALFRPPLLLANDLLERSKYAEKRLNDIYSQVRHTLSDAQKNALKQEELDWLQKRAQYSSGSTQWIELTDQRVRELEGRLSRAASTNQTQRVDGSGGPSPDGQYTVVGNEQSADAPGYKIALKTIGGEELLVFGTGVRLGYTAVWSADSKHLVVLIPRQFNGKTEDSVSFAELIEEKWRTVDYTIPGGSKMRVLSWESADAVRMQVDSKTFTFKFPKPTIFSFRLGRFASLTLDTTPGSEKVTVTQGDKTHDETVFESSVRASDARLYLTPRHTSFRLERLQHPVINDANRKINSGDWKLIVSRIVDSPLCDSLHPVHNRRHNPGQYEYANDQDSEHPKVII
jgi:hypothetical protein